MIALGYVTAAMKPGPAARQSIRFFPGPENTADHRCIAPLGGVR